MAAVAVCEAGKYRDKDKDCSFECVHVCDMYVVIVSIITYHTLLVPLKTSRYRNGEV